MVSIKKYQMIVVVGLTALAAGVVGTSGKANAASLLQVTPTGDANTRKPSPYRAVESRYRALPTQGHRKQQESSPTEMPLFSRYRFRHSANYGESSRCRQSQQHLQHTEYE